MPTTAVSQNAGVGVQTFTLSLPVERGRLLAVSVSQTDGAPTLGALNAAVFLALDPASPASIVAHLTAGIFTQYQPLGWTGDITLEPGMSVYARFVTNANVQVKMAIITEV